MAFDYQSGPTIMMQLGSFQFGISTAAYQELVRKGEWRWPAQEVLGVAPVLQFVGPGGETISLQGIVYPEWRGGSGQVSSLRALADEGKPQRMVDGTGAGLGQWVIETLEETQSGFAGEGRARKQEFTVSLRRLPDDGAAGIMGVVSGVASAVTGVAIPAAATGAVAQVQGLAGSVSSAAKSLSGTLSKVSQQVQAAVGPITAIARDALGAVNRSLGVVTELQDVANLALSSVGIRPIETNALLHADNLAARANRLLVNAQSASAVLRTSSAKMAQLSVPASATKAMQAAQAAADNTVSMTRQTVAAATTIKGQ